MMTLIEVIHAASIGLTIVSNAERRYTPEMLSPIRWIGKRAVSFQACGMTEGERRGTWKIESTESSSDSGSRIKVRYQNE